MNEANEKMVKVHVAENRFEADQIVEVLKREEIPFWVKDYTDTAYNGIYVSRKGWGGIWVPPAYESRAKTLIHELLETFLSDA